MEAVSRLKTKRVKTKSRIWWYRGTTIDIVEYDFFFCSRRVPGPTEKPHYKWVDCGYYRQMGIR